MSIYIGNDLEDRLKTLEMENTSLRKFSDYHQVVHEIDHMSDLLVQSVSLILAEFYFNRGLQRLYTGTCIILQKTINGFLCLLIVFLKSKTYQLILKDVIKSNRNLR